MTPETLGLRFPRVIPVGSPPVNYELDTSQCAICHPGSRTVPRRGDERLQWSLPDGNFVAAPMNSVDDDETYLPIYSNASAVGIATGLLFVRVAREEVLAQYRSEFTQIGLKIQSVPAYAPHAGWVATTDDADQQALYLIPKLVAQPWVVHVEAQLLRTMRESS